MAFGEQNRETGAGSSTAGSSQASLSASQLFFLQRLLWLEKQRHECTNVLASSDWRMRLLNKALYSTYQDCVAAGIEQQAKEILARGQSIN